jgi:uncharacterized protein (TIGR04222 family)
MNPFDLRGPEFLLFYTILGVVVLLVTRALVRGGEAWYGKSPTELKDPYELAYLRAGANEALQVATVSLMARGLLRASGDDVVAVAGASARVQRPIESEILSFFSRPRAAADLFRLRSGSPACERYRERLAERGLVPDGGQRRRRALIATAAVALLVSVSVVKIAVALARGRHNIAFLVILTALFAIVTVATAFPRRTPSGNALLGDLRDRYAALRARAAQIRPGGATNEVAFLAAAYGLSVLSPIDHPYVRPLFRKAVSSDGGSYSGGCGSSGCGGGGGCGGGCGGCGG